MAVSHNLPLLWHFWIQLPLQYDLHLPILQVETFNPRKNQSHVFQDAWRGQFSGKVVRFCHDVPLRRYLHDNFRLLCESAFPWSSLHYHACVRLGKKKSIHKVRDCHNFRFDISVAFLLGWTSLVSWHSMLPTCPGSCWDSLSSWATQSVLIY